MYCELQKRERDFRITAQPFRHVDKKQKSEGVYRLIFSDGKYKEYSVEELKEVDFFKGIFGRFAESASQEVSLKNIRSDIFEAAMGLSLRDQHIAELIKDNPELRFHPDLYEILKETLEYFKPGKNKELLRDLREHQLKHIDYREALKIYQEGDTTPVRVGIAKTVLNSRIYFESEEMAAKWTASKKKMEREFWIVNRQIEHFKKVSTGENLSELDRYIIYSQIHALAVHKVKLKHMAVYRHLTDDNLSMKCHELASRHIQSEDPEIKQKALESKRIVSEYKEKMLAALKNSGANMDRKDLLEHLVGPKNFLLSEYGLELKDQTDNQNFPFCHPLVRQAAGFGYSLDNPSPYDLETEIREDLENYIPHWLPPRIIESNVVTRPVTVEVQNLRDYFMEKLIHWRSLDEKVKNEAVQKLMELSGWTRYNIKPEDVEITEIKVDQLSSEAAGTIVVMNREFDFFLNTFDFVICFVGANGIRGNQFSTLQNIALLAGQRVFNPFINYVIAFRPPPQDGQ